MSYSEKAADRVVKFFGLLKHTKGRWAGQPFILSPWEKKEIIHPLFGTLNKDGTRQYRTAFIMIPKKNGKTEIASGIILYGLYADHEMGAENYSIAVDKEQAGLIYNVAAQMVRTSPILRELGRCIDTQKRILDYKTASFYHAVSADVPTKHGVNPHFTIADEVHAYRNRDLWDIFTQSSGTREQPLIFAITTAGYDKKSICYELYKYAKFVIAERKRGKEPDPTFFAYIREAPEDADWKDEKVWYACNPALGDFLNIDEMRSLAIRARETPAYENTFRRFRLNQWVEQAVRWMPMEAWDASAGKIDPVKLEGQPCYAGLDLASSIDIAALELVFLQQEALKVLSYFWIPQENIMKRVKKDKIPYDLFVKRGLIIATPGDVIDYAFIKHDILELNKKYAIKEIAYDRWGMVQLSQDLTEEGFTMVPFGQGFSSMASPTKELLTRILQKKIHHGGNEVLRWMANNVTVRQDPAGNIKCDKSKSTEKIDGIVALIMALDRAIRNEAGGKSVYEDRGILEIEV